MAKEKKGAKFGRHSRNPSSNMYTVAKRWVTNKAKAIKRNARRMAKKAIHRINWEIRTGRVTMQSRAQRLQELRLVVEKNS